MRGDMLLEKLEWIDMELIEAADRPPKKKEGRWIRWSAAAACLVIAAALLWPLVGQWQMGRSKASGEAPAALQDYESGMAAGGEAGVTEEAGEAVPEDSIVVNGAEGVGVTDMDVRYEPLDSADEQTLADFAANLGVDFDSFTDAVPEAFSLDAFYAVTAGGYVTGEYQLHDYCLKYKTESDGSVTIALCQFETPLRCVIVESENPKQSMINGVPLVIHGWQDDYYARFSYGGIYYDLEATGLTWEEFHSLLLGLLGE